VVSCAQLAHTPVIGRCPPGADTVTVPPFFDTGIGRSWSYGRTIWQPSSVSAARLSTLPVHAVLVQTNGSRAAVESARTVLELAFPSRFAPDTLSSLNPDNNRLLTAYKQLADVVVLVSLPIAGCSLAVSVVGGLVERKRPFSLMRLSGVPLTMLRRVVALEAVVPLLLTAAVAIGAGLVAAQLFLRGQLNETLQPPGLEYYLIVVAGLVVALGIIASTLPLLRRITGPETARNE
jgi:FtsX-like permease family protein